MNTVSDVQYDEEQHRRFVENLKPFLISDLSKREQIVLLRLSLETDKEKAVLAALEEENDFFFSMMNSNMVKADFEFFDRITREGWDGTPFYIPYMYGLAIDNNPEISERIRKEGLFRNTYGKNVVCKLVTSDTEIAEVKEEESVFSATEFFSASPIKFRKIKLIYNYQSRTKADDSEIEYLQEAVKEIKDLHVIDGYIRKHVLRNESEVKSAINERDIDVQNQNNGIGLFPTKRFVGSLKIYNVGQGFCAYLRENSRKWKVYFDIGLDYRIIVGKRYKELKYPLSRQQEVIIKENYKYIDKSQPSVLILSHWDKDHIWGITKVNPKHLPKLWLVPDITERRTTSFYAVRLFAFLLFLRRLIIVGNELNGKLLWNNDFIALYKSNMSEMTQGTIENNHGLITVIRGKIIIPGDANYQVWPEDLNIATHNYSYLIAPHHGGNAGPIPFPDEHLNLEANKVAIFSYGENNCFHHPNEEHIHILQARYHYSRENTMDSRYIVIHIDYDNRNRDISGRQFLLE